jgi:CHASE3 domain sensor protein
MTAGFSLRGLLVALGIVALGLPAAFAGLFGAITQIDRFNSNIALVREGQLNIADLLRLQSDEQTGVRGYAATGDPGFRDLYRAAVSEFPVHASAAAERLVFGGDDERARVALADALALDARWRRNVAEPAFAHRSAPLDERQAAGLVRGFRNDIEIVSAVLIEDYHRQFRLRAFPIAQASWIAFGSIVVVALQILVYAFLVDRLRGELVRERRVVAVLQTAFSSEIVNDARLDVAATYVSATRGAKVGGDVYDIFPLDADRTLVVIADVSGKGVEAAIDSTFVKYSLRALANEYPDISTIVTKFNRLYGRAQKQPEAFVVVFAGILDHRSATLSYVSAGHEAAYVRRSTGIQQLAPTGPIIGITEDAAFASAATAVTAHDVLVLSTDGLTEARDPRGVFLTSAGVEAWLAEADPSSARHLVDTLARRLRRYTRDRSNDDLAIVAVRPKPPPSNAKAPPPYPNAAPRTAG